MGKTFQKSENINNTEEINITKIVYAFKMLELTLFTKISKSENIMKIN